MRSRLSPPNWGMNAHLGCALPPEELGFRGGLSGEGEGMQMGRGEKRDKQKWETLR